MTKTKYMFNKVAICGMGVMGASLGYDLLNKNIAKEVYGFIRKPETGEKIISLKLATDAGNDPSKAFSDADMIVLAVPTGVVSEQLKLLLPFVKKHTIITDLCSVKQKVVTESEKILKGKADFVGSHPMTGTEKFGFSNFIKELYKNATCIVTPTKNTSLSASEKTIKMWQILGSNVYKMTPGEHDIGASLISHLPHVVSNVLMASIWSEKEKIPGLFNMSAGSFRDMTRIVESSPELWADIFLNNKKEVLNSIKVFQKKLDLFTQNLKHENVSDILNYLNNTNKSKKYINEKI